MGWPSLQPFCGLVWSSAATHRAVWVWGAGAGGQSARGRAGVRAQTRRSPALFSAGRSDVSTSSSWYFSAAWLLVTCHSVVYNFANDFVWTNPNTQFTRLYWIRVVDTLVRIFCSGVPLVALWQNPPANAGNTGSTPDPGAEEQPCPCISAAGPGTWDPVYHTEQEKPLRWAACANRSESSRCSLQLEKALQQRRPAQP